jgi:hypothetical protein
MPSDRPPDLTLIKPRDSPFKPRRRLGRERARYSAAMCSNQVDSGFQLAMFWSTLYCRAFAAGSARSTRFRAEKATPIDGLWPVGGQKGPRPHGNAGIPGIPGNVVCITYRIYRMPERPNPSLSANYKYLNIKYLYL